MDLRAWHRGPPGDLRLGWVPNSESATCFSGAAPSATCAGLGSPDESARVSPRPELRSALSRTSSAVLINALRNDDHDQETVSLWAGLQWLDFGLARPEGTRNTLSDIPRPHHEL
jgi:hypothetical protein